MTSYEAVIQETLCELSHTERPIILFCAGSAGIMGKRALDYLKISAVCFCDNNAKRQGTMLEGLTVLSPKEAQELYPDALVFICAFFHYKTIVFIEEQLKNTSFHVQNWYPLYYVYQIHVIQRDIDPSSLAAAMGLMCGHVESNQNTDIFIMDKYVPAVAITDKCTLRCVDCSRLTIHNKNAGHYNKDTIMKSMQRLSNSVDAINMLAIYGGEPLLHPDVVEICQAAAKLPNVLGIYLVTNGTIMPANILNKLKGLVTYVIVSNYGNLSVRAERIKDVCADCGIVCEMSEESPVWCSMPAPAFYNRSEADNVRKFISCKVKPSLVSMGCGELRDGKYYVCTYASVGSYIGAFQENEENFVDLLNEDFTAKCARERLKYVVSNPYNRVACQYCNIGEKWVPAAVQG